MQNACWLLPSRAYRSLWREHGSEVEAEAVVGAHGERLDVDVLEEVVERDGTGRGRVLEERVVEVPGPELVLRAAEASRERRVELALPLGERLLGGAVDVGQGCEQPVFVELAGVQREREVVAVPEVTRRLVAQPSELPDVVRRPRGPICLAAFHAARRSAGSSLVRRISAIVLSSTRRPSICPRKLLKVDSTRVSSSTMARRRSAGTCCGTNAS